MSPHIQALLPGVMTGVVRVAPHLKENEREGYRRIASQHLRDRDREKEWLPGEIAVCGNTEIMLSFSHETALANAPCLEQGDEVECQVVYFRPSRSYSAVNIKLMRMLPSARERGVVQSLGTDKTTGMHTGTLRSERHPGLLRFRGQQLFDPLVGLSVGDSVEFNVRAGGQFVSRVALLPRNSVQIISVESQRVVGRISFVKNKKDSRAEALVLHASVMHPVCFAPSETQQGTAYVTDVKTSATESKPVLTNADFRAQFGLAEVKKDDSRPLPTLDSSRWHAAYVVPMVHGSKSNFAIATVGDDSFAMNLSKGLIAGDLVTFQLARYSAEPAVMLCHDVSLNPKRGIVVNISSKGGAIASTSSLTGTKDFIFVSSSVEDGISLELGDTVDILECAMRTSGHDIREPVLRHANKIRLVSRAIPEVPQERKQFKTEAQKEREKAGKAPVIFRPRYAQQAPSDGFIGFARVRPFLGYFPAPRPVKEAAAETPNQKRNQPKRL